MGLIDPAVHPKPGMNKGNIGWAEIPDDRLDYETLRMEVYAAMVDRMDREIGRVLEALEREGIADNTLIIFLSDNGGCAEQPGGRTPEQIPGPKDFYSHCGPDWAWAQNAPFRRYKSTTYEGGIATPMVARWPKGIEAGQTTDQVGHIIDFLPTFLELAGGEYPNSVKGNPVLLPEGMLTRSGLNWQKPNHRTQSPTVLALVRKSRSSKQKLEDCLGKGKRRKVANLQPRK